MSQTQSLSSRSSEDTRTINRITNRAKNIIKQSLERRPVVIVMANTLIDDFSDLAHQLKGTPPRALISKAKLVSTPVGIKPARDHEDGAAIGELALTLSFRVGMNELTFNDARKQLDREIRAQLNKHKQEKAERKQQRQLKPSIPVDSSTSQWGGTKPSPKQRYHHGKRRKAA